LDINTGLTQVLANGTHSYLYGQGRIAQEGEAIEYFLGDALSSVRQLVDSSAEVTLIQSYEPFGNTLSSVGDGVSIYQFTGEIMDSYIKLLFLRSRYMSTDTGRFTTKDVWDGNDTTPLSYNAWLYVNGNPINFTDPKGLYLCERFDCDGEDDFKWQGELIKQDELFSLVFRGSGFNGTWTKGDWEYYCKNRDYIYQQPGRWKINPDSEEGWDLFALHAKRLASHYELREKTQFVRDFGLLFAGIPSNSHWALAAWQSREGPPVVTPTDVKSYLAYKNTGLSQIYIDVNEAFDQSHHYAGLFFLGYFTGPEIPWIIGIGREWGDNNPGDILLGDRAAIDAYYFRYYSGNLESISDYILRLKEMRNE